MSQVSVIIGDDSNVCFQVLKADGSAEDLTDFDEISLVIKRSTQDPESAAVWKGTLTGNDITIKADPDTDVCTVLVPADVTILLRYGRPYYYALSLDGDDGHSTPNSGDLFANYKTD